MQRVPATRLTPSAYLNNRSFTYLFRGYSTISIILKGTLIIES